MKKMRTTLVLAIRPKETRKIKSTTDAELEQMIEDIDETYEVITSALPSDVTNDGYHYSSSETESEEGADWVDSDSEEEEGGAATATWGGAVTWGGRDGKEKGKRGGGRVRATGGHLQAYGVSYMEMDVAGYLMESTP
ncbi:hypothetical protein LguiA_029271 [Lonicera macranthoides]